MEHVHILVKVKGIFEEGEQVLTAAFGKHADNLAAVEKAKAHFLRAEVHQRKHENDKVVQDLRTAIQLAPAQVSFQAELGVF